MQPLNFKQTVTTTATIRRGGMPNLAKPAALHALQPQPRPLIQMSPIGVTAALFQKTQAKAVVTLRPLPRNCATKPIFGSIPQALHRAHREKKEILTAFCSGVTNPKAAQLLSASLLLFGSHFAASGGRGTFSPSAMQGSAFRSVVRSAAAAAGWLLVAVAAELVVVAAKVGGRC